MPDSNTAPTKLHCKENLTLDTPPSPSTPVDELIKVIHSISHMDLPTLDAMLEAFEKRNWVEGEEKA